MHPSITVRHISMIALLACALLFLLGLISSEQQYIPKELFPPSTKNLTTRAPPTAQIYTAAVTKGHQLLCLMNAPLSPTTQSHYLSHSALAQNGWESNYKTFSQEDLHTQGLVPALTALHISTRPEDWIKVREQHHATTAQYFNNMNPHDGALVAEFNLSPEHMVEQDDLPRERVPALKRWSDVVWLEWEKLCKEKKVDVRNLEHVFQYKLSNDDTVKFLRLVKGKGRGEGVEEFPPAWPGWQYHLYNDEAKAVISSSNGYGVAYLLATHEGKDQFGLRVIDQVNIFSVIASEKGKWERFWCMYLHIRPGPL